MEKKAVKDFFFSFVLIALGIYCVIEGMRIYRVAAAAPYNITEFTISPAFLPVVLGVSLVLCSLALCIQSLKAGGKSLQENWHTYWMMAKKGLAPALRHRDTVSLVVGLAIIAVYTFLLLGRLPFWAASLLFLVPLMVYLRAAKPWKILVVSCVGIGLVYLLFQVAFKTSLP
jgi:uncharacterized membrane protein